MKLVIFSIILLIFIIPIDEFGRTEGTNILLDPRVACNKTNNIKDKLADFCRRNPGLLNEITKGIDLGFQECQFQFKDRQWNCTFLRRSLRKILIKDTRETSFVNAIAAAGISYSVTRACSTGALVECSCDKNSIQQDLMLEDDRRNSIQDIDDNSKYWKRSRRRKNYVKEKRNEVIQKRRDRRLLQAQKLPTGKWKWGGCGDDVKFGFRKSRQFLNFRRRKRSDIKALVLLHNYNAGRMAIKRNMRVDCKCHGVSGSCAIKTCWLRMPTFREVGSYLKQKFDGASKVISANDGNSFIPAISTTKKPNKLDLVYTDESQNFCKFNFTTGSLGTFGRKCNPNSDGIDGCEILCCNRGYEHKTIIKNFSCDCVFKWCCQVKCKTCTEEHEISTCK